MIRYRKKRITPSVAASFITNDIVPFTKIIILCALVKKNYAPKCSFLLMGGKYNVPVNTFIQTAIRILLKYEDKIKYIVLLTPCSIAQFKHGNGV